MTRDITPALIVVEESVVDELVHAGGLEIDVSMCDDGAVRGARDFCDLSGVVSADALEVVKVCKGSVIDGVNLTLDTIADAWHVEQVRRVVAAAHHERERNGGAEIANVRGAFQ